MTVPTEPEIPRLFELRLNVTEFADAIGAMAKAAAIDKTDIAILRLLIFTARSPFATKLFHPLMVSGARLVPNHSYLQALIPLSIRLILRGFYKRTPVNVVAFHGRAENFCSPERLLDKGFNTLGGL